jgi:DNA polymerase III sliding clamp (beta) subunit (PCNA family)
VYINNERLREVSVMKWNDAMWKLVELSRFVADERFERGGLFGALHFFSDGYAWGGNEVFEFELRCGVNFDGVVSASKFYDVCRVLDKRIEYDIGVDGEYFFIKGEGTDVKINMMQVDVRVNRMLEVISESEELMRGLKIGWREGVVNAIKRIGKIALSGSSISDYKVVCFDSEGIYATDRVRIACCFMPFILGDGRVLLSVEGVKQLVDVAEDERVVGAWVLGNKLYVKFDGDLCVSVAVYDVDFPNVKSVFKKYEGSVMRFGIDKIVADEVSKIVKALDQNDVVNLVVSGGWLELRVRSVRGFELKRRLLRVGVDGDYEVGVLAKDIDNVIDGAVELGFSDEVLYCRSEEGVEYIVATINS